MDLKLPIGWSIKPLAQVANVRSGVAVSKAKLKDPVRLPYLRVANVQAGWLDLTEIKSIEVERHQVQRFTLQKGDVLMTEGGDYDKLGRGDLWQGEIEPCLHQNHVFAVRTDRQQILPEFLNALSNSAHGRRYFLSCAKRSTNLASISASQLKAFPVLLPTLDEQEKICVILQSWEQSLACADKIIANRKLQQQGLRQMLFAGETCLQWPRVALAKVADLPTESISIQEEGGEFSFEYITLTDVDCGRIGKLTRMLLADAPSRARRKVQQDDILISTVRPGLQGYARIDAMHADCIVSTGFGVVRAKPDKVEVGFLYHYLFSADIQHQIRTMVTGSSYPSINLTDIANLTISLPSLATQKNIGTILDAAETEIRLAQRQRDILLAEKQLWTQRLVTGEWRVPGMDGSVAANRP
jgi:type I restriction enzyme S subunit